MSGRVNFSQLTRRITIQKLTTTTNENGFTEEQWIDFQNVWASMNNLSGREFWSAKAVQSENTVEFCIRYAQFVDTMDSKTYRIAHGNKVYNITFIDNNDFRKTFVKIRTLELIP